MVLLAFDGSPRAEQALRLLCHQARGRPNIEIRALNVLRVPTSRDLDANWPDEDLPRLLLCNRACEIGQEEGAFVFGQIARARSLADAILGVALEDGLARIVIPFQPDRSWKQRWSSRRLVRRLLMYAPCPVELLYLPAEEALPMPNEQGLEPEIRKLE